MKIIALEEHFATPEVIAAWKDLPSQEQDVGLSHSTEGETGRRLLDLGDDRLAAMDEAGVDIQVISLTTPGVQSLSPADAVRLQVQTNDRLADAVRRRPDRLRGLASLATPSPADAVRELERAINVLGFDGAVLHGRTRERNLDHPDFWPIYEAAAALRAPIYIHPQSPRPAVREAYYEGLDPTVSALFSIAGIGWHYETGIQILRMILAGVFDRFPGLQLVTGHWGEVVLFYLDRIDILARPAKLAKPVSAYFREHVSVTPSGLFSPRYLRWAVEVLGVERIMFSTDYPFQRPTAAGARQFLELADLPPADREKVASGNWETLLSPIRR